MEYPIHINTISMGLSILYFKGLPVKASIYKMMYYCPRRLFLSLKIENSADPDEMLPYVAFHLGLHCLPKYPFISIQNGMG